LAAAEGKARPNSSAARAHDEVTIAAWRIACFLGFRTGDRGHGASRHASDRPAPNARRVRVAWRGAAGEWPEPGPRRLITAPQAPPPEFKPESRLAVFGIVPGIPGIARRRI